MRIKMWWCVLSIALQGCGAHFNSIYRSDTIGDMSVRAVDAKQRLVFARPTDKGMIVCPEPSPDALSAGGASVDASADTIGKLTGLALGGASSESAGSIGLRTQTISLLRDQMTQLCLRRMAGAIGDAPYAEELRQLHVSALGMLAIEQITGATKAPPVIVNVGAQKTSAAGTDAVAAEKTSAPSVNVTLTAAGSVGAASAAAASAKGTNEAVLDVLRLVLNEGFNSFDCRESKRKLRDAKPGPEKNDAAEAVAAECRTAGETGALALTGLSSESDTQLVANKLAANDPGRATTFKASAASAIRRLGPLPETSSRPLAGYDIGLFVCRAASDEAFVQIGRIAQEAVQPKTSGTVVVKRLDDAAFRSRSGGLDPAARKSLTVFYDAGDSGAEQRFAETLLAALGPRLEAFGLKIEAKPNRTEQKDTPFYLSAWLCP